MKSYKSSCPVFFSEELTILHSKTMVKPPSFTCPSWFPRSFDTSEARQSSERSERSERERSQAAAAAACQSRASRANAQLGNR